MDITQFGGNNNEGKNGRIDIRGSNSKPYDLYQEHSLENGMSYKNESLRSIQTESLLSKTFFSSENIDSLQNMLRYNVWLKSNKRHVIGRQSETQLHIVMRSIYLQYAQNRDNGIAEQIKQLNSLVLDYCIPRVISEVEQYIAYKKNVSELPRPLERAKNMSSSGEKSLEFKRWI
tara:strand:+ start:15 stop:539 length:525 start_codon:yes stop_codon:yes gene_type:complete